ncbi:MAG TPA: hypothetical protein VJN43_14395 [Bryobacteraceae bacterium]|nr:hypothetical protein [Bryobacteraceae bacterium]
MTFSPDIRGDNAFGGEIGETAYGDTACLERSIIFGACLSNAQIRIRDGNPGRYGIQNVLKRLCSEELSRAGLGDFPFQAPLDGQPVHSVVEGRGHTVPQ